LKPTLPKGTRDFLPSEVKKRRYIFNTIKEVFESYGYDPIETPVMESLSTLTGKYGDEGDQLLFKVLNNGDYLSKADQSALTSKDSNKLTSSISKRGLRYDLTVPFARFVVMHQNDIQFPFKRYQIQQVWRADRPQKGRYQEFYQCDADIVGSDSLMYEAELAAIYDTAFHKLGINVTIKYNNRKVLYGITEAAGVEERFKDITVVIDKLDKIGEEGVQSELEKNNISQQAIETILALLKTNDIDELELPFKESETGLKGLEEIREFQSYLTNYDQNNSIVFDPTLARGLSYYTGCIFEVAANDVEMGSIGGGGRYADLTGVFGLKGVSGVGISFGAERIYDVMLELNLFNEISAVSSQVIILALDKKAHSFAFRQANILRNQGIDTELYPSPVKMKKQMKYANSKGIPHVIIIGEEEIESGLLTLKDMTSGESGKYSLADIMKKLKHGAS
jgi:histidyl-tRNA synthetase